MAKTDDGQPNNLTGDANTASDAVNASVKSRAQRNAAKNTARLEALEREAQNERRAAQDAENARNSIRQSKPRLKRQAVESDSPADAKPNPETTQGTGDRRTPDHVAKKFTRVGDTLYFPDGTLAIVDQGTRLTSPTDNLEVSRARIAIGIERNWTGIALEGSERFKSEAWIAGRLAGLEVE